MQGTVWTVHPNLALLDLIEPRNILVMDVYDLRRHNVRILVKLMSLISPEVQHIDRLIGITYVLSSDPTGINAESLISILSRDLNVCPCIAIYLSQLQSASWQHYARYSRI